jgi:hypothetical protein
LVQIRSAKFGFVARVTASKNQEFMAPDQVLFSNHGLFQQPARG